MYDNTKRQPNRDYNTYDNVKRNDRSTVVAMIGGATKEADPHTQKIIVRRSFRVTLLLWLETEAIARKLWT